MPEDTPKEIVEDEEYRESEDEDFNPDEVDDNISSDGDVAEEDALEAKDDSDIKKRKSVVSEEIGNKKQRYDNEIHVDDGQDFKVRTRSQRAADDAEARRATDSKNTSTVDTDAIWKSLRESPTSIESGKSENSSAGDDLITITYTYEFAKDIITKEKQVLRNSVEAQEYLKLQDEKRQRSSKVLESTSDSSNEVTSKSSELPRPKPMGGPRRRKTSSLEAMATSAKPKKLNTLEKSKLDWQGYVEEEGIADELRQHNQGGYLQKQDFLNRVDKKRYEDMKNGQKTSNFSKTL
ncbi:bucentaur or craniofacial development-domain-containing protein [Dipodascopsis uninucleata]